MEFDEEELKESATHVPDNYEPKFFINPALGQSLVFIFSHELSLFETCLSVSLDLHGAMGTQPAGLLSYNAC